MQEEKKAPQQEEEEEGAATSPSAPPQQKKRQRERPSKSQRKQWRKNKREQKRLRAGGTVPEEQREETEYFFRDGLRFVRPYYYDFKVHAKERWLGKTLLQLFLTEFRGHTPSYYQEAIERGDISVNGKTVGPDTIIQRHDLVVHRIHRHEPPVSAEPIQLLAQDEDLVVVNKPPSIPVHPCGRYRHNTVLFILAKEHGLSNLHCVHRLDRLTSGILLLAKSRSAAERFSQQIASPDAALENTLNKVYVARIRGEFPRKDKSIVVEEPIVIVNHRLGICKVSPEGKPAKTTFEFHSYDAASNTSIVYCSITTGRTHQIRVHLQWLGFPIANDPLYGNQLTRTTTDHEKEKEKENEGDEEQQQQQEAGEEDEEGQAIASTVMMPCEVCGQDIPAEDPLPEELCMWLHAYSYSYEGKWKHRTELPSWATFKGALASSSPAAEDTQSTS
ncbi:RNA pseudouridylate synthase domain containing protein 2 [Balamuthia mandrillaris]